MDKKIIKFDDIEIEEYEFHKYKCDASIKDLDINEIVVSNKFFFDKQHFQYFIVYKYHKEIRNLSIFFQEISIFKSYYDKTNVFIL